MTQYNSLSEAWYAKMRERYQTDDEGVREIMRQRQLKSMEARKQSGKKHRGGFSNPEVAKKASRLGVQARLGSTSREG